MDQIKIGKFISECRKKQNLTQSQLAEKLSVTDRAVSKWETGKAMPDSSLMIDLCKILKISVNDLLSGESMTDTKSNNQLENNLLELIRKKEENDKRWLAMEWVVAGLSVIVLIIPIIIGCLIEIEEWKRVIIAFSGFIPAIIGLMFALKIEQLTGFYECEMCHHKYVPTFMSFNFAMHMGRTRYMKCPKCGKKSWQKKVIN